jgi:hypothetical protein
MDPTSSPARPGVPAVPDPDGGRDRFRFAVAAQRALRAYPGPAGELIRRELLAAANLGYLGERPDRDALLLRLCQEILG